MGFKEFTGELDSPVRVRPFTGELDREPAQQDLPEGVEPSDVGAGRSGGLGGASIEQGRSISRTRGGLSSEMRPYVAGGLDGVQSVRRLDNRIEAEQQAKTPLLERPYRGPQPSTFTPDEMAGLGSLEVSPEKALRDSARLKAPDAKPFTTAQNIAQDVREFTDNPVARGAVSGFSNLGQVGVGAVRAGAELAGAGDVAQFAQDTSRTASTIGDGATRGLGGNDKLIADVTASIVNSLPAVALGTMGGPALRTLFAQSAAADYAETGNAAHAGIMGAAEALGERFGFSEQIRLLKGVVKGMPSGEVAKVLGAMLAKEVPGEQATTAMQFLADKFGPGARNPNATFEDYLNQAGETLKVTLGQTAVMGGGPAAITTGKEQLNRADAAIDRGSMNLYERAAKDAGFRPAELRKQTESRFDDYVAEHGMPAKLVSAIKEAAADKPLAKLPEFYKQATRVLAEDGLFTGAVDDAAFATLDQPIEAPAAETQQAEPAAQPAPVEEDPQPQKAPSVKVGGLSVAVELPAGSVLRGVDQDGQPYEVEHTAHQGTTTEGVPVLVRLETPKKYAGTVYVVKEEDGTQRGLIGYASEEQALEAYQQNRPGSVAQSVTSMPIKVFKLWVTNPQGNANVASPVGNDGAGLPVGSGRPGSELLQPERSDVVADAEAIDGQGLAGVAPDAVPDDGPDALAPGPVPSRGNVQSKNSEQPAAEPADGKSRAVAGGQDGINGYAYKGGQFLPSTMAEPGKWKVKGKWVNAGKEQTEPGKYELQPTPFSRSIYSLIGGWLAKGGDKAKLYEGADGKGIRDNTGQPLTLESEVRPGVKGVLGKQALTVGELIDAYNNGQRWFDVQPDAETVTTDAAAPAEQTAPAQAGVPEAAAPSAEVDQLVQRLKTLTALKNCLKG